MTWRCANKRRKRAAPMEPHLGDVPNMDMPPMTLHRPHERFGAVKVKAWPGVVIVCAIVLAAFLAAMARAKAADKFVDPHEKEVVSDCSADALRFCKLAIPRGRDKIIDCMQANKPKLQAKCSRHLW